jgi:hypothetical protein
MRQPMSGRHANAGPLNLPRSICASPAITLKGRALLPGLTFGRYLLICGTR